MPGTSQLNDGQRSALLQKTWTDFGNHGVLTAATLTVWSAYNHSRESSSTLLFFENSLDKVCFVWYDMNAVYIPLSFVGFGNCVFFSGMKHFIPDSEPCALTVHGVQFFCPEQTALGQLPTRLPELWGSKHGVRLEFVLFRSFLNFVTVL